MPELTLDAFKQHVDTIRAEIGKVIVGQETVVTNVLIALIGGGHVLLEGVPGLGKTMLVRTLGQALDLKFARIQFTPDLMPADIIGTDILEEDEGGRRHFRYLRQFDSGRRNQPGHAQNPVGPAGGHARADRHCL